MTDAEAHFRAILENPACDVTRLSYADRLEEAAGTVACDHCKGKKFDPFDDCKVCSNLPDEDGVIEHGRGCYTQDADGGGDSMADDCPKCKGEGTVSNGNAERAEFIRVQVELAGITYRDQTCRYCRANCGECKSKYCSFGDDPDGKNSHRWENPRRDELRNREGELWSARAYGKAPEGFIATLVTDYFGRMDDHRLAVYRRGFVAEIHTTLAYWVGESERRTVTRNNGSSESFEVARSTGYGPRIVAGQPVERVEVSDAPHNWVTVVPGKLKRYEFQIPERDIVAARSVDGFRDLLTRRMKEFAALFPDIHDVHTQADSGYAGRVGISFVSEIPSLSLALVQWARREAGLPPLTPSTAEVENR